MFLPPLEISNLMPAVNLSPSDISVIHRLPSSSPANLTASSGRQKPPPVIMKLVRRQSKHSLMSNRKLLKGKQIVISEHLSPSRAALLKRASLLVSNSKLQSAWSHDGKILIKTLANRTLQILSDADFAPFN